MCTLAGEMLDSVLLSLVDYRRSHRVQATRRGTYTVEPMYRDALNISPPSLYISSKQL